MWKIPLMWVLLACLFGLHIVGLGATIAAIMASWWAQRRSGDRQAPSFAVLGTALLPGAAFAGVYLLGPQPPSVGWNYEGPLGQVYSMLTFTWGSLTDTGRVLLALWIAGVLTATAWTAWRHRGPIYALVPAVSLASLGVVLPVDMGSMWPGGPRLLPFVLMLCIASIRFPERARSRAAATSFALLAALSFATTKRVMEVDREYRTFVDVIAKIEPGSRVLPIVGDVTAGSRMTWPYLPLVAVVAIERGGRTPYTFASPYIFTNASPLRYREEPGPEMRALFDPASKPAAFENLAGRYDYVVGWDLPPRLRPAVDAAFRELAREGRTTLFGAR
jgi:hypothetical protein